MDKKIKLFFKNIDTKNLSSKELQKLKIQFAKKNHLKDLPLTSDILANLKIKKPTSTFITKPGRTQSGVTIIAVMTKPDKCPGKCIYCPSYKGAPKSYTGFEPAAMRGKNNNFDPYKQIKDRLKQLSDTGHPTNKIELIVMGGTFPATELKYQKKFMIGIYQAITDSKENNLEKLKKIAMTSKRRMVGLTFETRPDYCDNDIIKRLLSYGGTRVELGVQTTDNSVFKKIKRGHTTKEVIEATKRLKDSGFKVLYHMMIGLPRSNLKKDYKMFKDIFENSDYCPDMLKIYPCLVTKNTVLEKMYYSGAYKTYNEKDVINLIADVKEKIVPEWVRIMRIQRDIPANKIIAGIQKSNLRELVQKELNQRHAKCNCIKCNEPINHKINFENNYEIKKIEYKASDGREIFIFAKINGYLLGFIRLRLPYKPFIKELKEKTSIVRELHIYGQATEFNDQNIQHRGIGKELLKEAEKYSLKHKFTKIAVISGIGVREYYKTQKYKLIGSYMIKNLKND